MTTSDKVHKCPGCNQPVDPAAATKIVAHGDGTNRRGAPGYRDQRDQVKFWHPACVESFNAQNEAYRAKCQRELEDQLRDLGYDPDVILKKEAA